MPPVVKTSISLPQETLDQLDALIDADGGTRAGIIRALVDEAAQKRLGKHAPAGPGKIRPGRPKRNVAKEK